MILDKEIQEIKGRSYPGSSTKDAKLYHDLPFPGMDNYTHHRRNTRERIERIAKVVKLKGKSVLDIGCSVGGITLGMAEKGATNVVGIDYDDQSIAVARVAAQKLGYNVVFENKKILIEYVMDWPHYDVIIWLSNWMWIVKRYGMEYAKELLFQVSKKCNTLVFESAADDGMARIKNATQNDIHQWLEECIVHQRIVREQGVGGWMNRDLFFCKEPLICIDASKKATTSCIIRSSRNRIKKIYLPEHKWMKEREIEAYKRMAPYGHTPIIINEGDGWIEMQYVGRHRNIDYKKYRTQAMDIISAMKKCGITHRDIKHANILKFKEKIYIIDFGWAIFDDEKDTPIKSPRTLHGKHYGTEEESMARIFKYKVKTT